MAKGSAEVPWSIYLSYVTDSPLASAFSLP